jgi:AAA+ ATPase superfamily predicted ATPase
MDYIKEAFDFADRFRKEETFEELGESMYVGVVFKPIFNKLTWIKISKHTILIGPNGGGKSKLISLLNNYFYRFSEDLDHLYKESDTFDFICIIAQREYQYDHVITDHVISDCKKILLTNFYASSNSKNSGSDADDTIYSIVSMIKLGHLHDLGKSYSFTDSEFFKNNSYVDEITNHDFYIGDEFIDIVNNYFTGLTIQHRFEISEPALSYYYTINRESKESLKYSEINNEFMQIYSFLSSRKIFDSNKIQILNLLVSMNNVSTDERIHTFDFYEFILSLYTISISHFCLLFSRYQHIGFNRGIRDINLYFTKHTKMNITEI